MRSVTHELKAPIMAIDAQLLNFLDSLDESSDEYNTVLSCYTHLQVLKRLVNEMLNLSKTEFIVYHGFTDVTSVTEEICDMYEYMSNDKHLKIKKI